MKPSSGGKLRRILAIVLVLLKVAVDNGIPTTISIVTVHELRSGK